MNRAVLLGVAVAAPFIIGGTVLAQAMANDDWKLYICAQKKDDKCYDKVNIYIKEWKPRKGVTCWVANAEGSTSDYRAGENASISCIKD